MNVVLLVRIMSCLSSSCVSALRRKGATQPKALQPITWSPPSANQTKSPALRRLHLYRPTLFARATRSTSPLRFLYCSLAYLGRSARRYFHTLSPFAFIRYGSAVSLGLTRIAAQHCGGSALTAHRIWRDIDEKKTSPPPTKVPGNIASSWIQRRQSIHGRRNRARPSQQRRGYPPPLERARPLPNSIRNARRHARAGLPSIESLLEPADDYINTPPPPAPEPRNFDEMVELDTTHTEAESQRVPTDARSRSRRVVSRRMLLESTNRLTSSLRANTNVAHTQPDNNTTETRLTSNEAVTTLLGGTLPTPPHDRSHMRDAAAGSDSWSRRQVDGLGDRDRSPIPTEDWPAAESWSPMRSTIAPDTTLPSADSSFTSAAASRSFTTSTASTSTTGDEDSTMPPQSDGEVSASSVDADDICADEDEDIMLDATEALARDYYYHEMQTEVGRQRIAEQDAARRSEGNRFALANEPACVDIGFRLIENALERVESRRRERRESDLNNDADLTRLAEISERNRQRRREVRQTSNLDAVTSTDAPEAHPVSPPDNQPQGEPEDSILIDANLSVEQDLEAMRRIVDRLSSRDDVPEHWWMEMGLNMSRARPRSQRNASTRGARRTTDLSRVRTGRIHRIGNADGERESRL